MAEQATHSNHRAAVIGPLPPPIHGQALVGLELQERLNTEGWSSRSWSITGANEAADIGERHWRKALSLLGSLPRLVKSVRAYEPHVIVTTIGIGDSMAVALRDCLVPKLLNSLTGAKTVGYMCGHASPELTGNRCRRSLLARLLGLFDHLLIPYDGALDELNIDFETTVHPYTSHPPTLSLDEWRSRRETLRQQNSTGSSPVVLFMANLMPGKGCVPLLHAVRELTDRGVECMVRVVGAESSDQTFDELEALAASLDISDHMQFVGPLPAEARWDEFHLADVVALPTTYRAEMLPLSLIDALGAGAAIMATTWRGIGPTFEDCDAAALVDDPDPGQIADAIASLLGRDREDLRSQALSFFASHLGAAEFDLRLKRTLLGQLTDSDGLASGTSSVPRKTASS